MATGGIEAAPISATACRRAVVRRTSAMPARRPARQPALTGLDRRSPRPALVCYPGGQFIDQLGRAGIPRPADWRSDVLSAIDGPVKGSRALLALSVTVTEIVLAGCSRHPAGIEALASALGPVRTIEPRLAGSFGFSPCQPEPGPQPVVRRVRCASPAMLGAPARRELAVAAQQIRRQAARRPSAATLHAEGLLDLLLSRDGRDVERSVRLLERARTAAPTDAQIVSDLAAGYLVRAAARNDALDLALALDAAEHAVGAAPALPAAQFNRALALEQLALVSEARAAWTAYLA